MEIQNKKSGNKFIALSAGLLLAAAGVSEVNAQVQEYPTDVHLSPKYAVFLKPYTMIRV